MDLYVHIVRDLWTRLAYVKKDLLHIFFFIFGDGLQLELLTSTKLLSFILNDLRLMPRILDDPPYFWPVMSGQRLSRPWLDFACLCIRIVRGSGYITNQNGETISFWFLNNNIFLSIFFRNEFIFLVLETMSEITVFVFVRERKVGVTNWLWTQVFPHSTLYYEAGIIALVGGGGDRVAAVLDCESCLIRPCTRSLAVSSMELLVTKPWALTTQVFMQSSAERNRFRLRWQ